MSHKTECIKARVSKQTKQLFQRLAKQEKLSCSKLLRALIHSFDEPVTISPEQRDELQYHFTNTARIGGLLNQIAYHLNSKNLQIINGKQAFMELDAQQLYDTCKQLEGEIQRVKKMLTKINRGAA